MKIVFDIGGTHLRAGRAEDGRISGAVVRATPQNYAEGLRALTEMADSLAEGGVPQAVVAGIAGVVRGGVLSRGSNLPGWEGHNPAQDAAEAWGAHFALQNDAALGCLGEALHGAGKGRRIVAYIAVGTGIGGARTVDGRLEESASGFEPGKQIIDAAHGTTWEGAASGQAMMQKWGVPVGELRREAREEWVRLLAVGLQNIILEWSPDTLVLGGGVMLAAPALVGEIERHLKKTFTAFPLPSLALATLGDESGLWGAMAWKPQNKEAASKAA